MDQKTKIEILEKFKLWFKDSLIQSHIQNTKKLRHLKNFQINPFLLYYLSNYFKGNSDSLSLAKTLIYPRVLGTSINTSFGTHIQSFIVTVLGAYGSHTQGLDLEFIDQVDNRKKFCQLKSGPNVINKNDVKTVKDHFRKIEQLARSNKGDLRLGDLVFCLIYGKKDQKNAFIKELEKDYDVLIGQEFWYRLTGDYDFYSLLIQAAGEVAVDVNNKNILDEVVRDLSREIDTNLDEYL